MIISRQAVVSNKIVWDWSAGNVYYPERFPLACTNKSRSLISDEIVGCWVLDYY
jgi:hypothetical protein